MGEIRLDYCCRLCLKEGFSLTNIFSQRSASGDPIYRILNFIYEMKIFENDGLPSQICSPCMRRMIEFDACKKNVRSAEAEIVRLLSQTRPHMNEVSNHGSVIVSEDNEMDGAVEVGIEGSNFHSDATIKDEINVFEMENPIETDIKEPIPETVQHLKETDFHVLESIEIKADEVTVEEFEDNCNEHVFCQPLREVSINEEMDIVELDMPAETVIKVPEAVQHFQEAEEDDYNDIESDDMEPLELPEEEYEEKCNEQVFYQPLKESIGSSDLKNCLSLEASEETVGDSIEGESSSICTSQDIYGKNVDVNKGMPEYDLRCNVLAEEESLSTQISKSILNVSKSGRSNLKASLIKRKSEFICDICKKSFKQKVFLGYHVRIHYEERLFSCTTCDKRFKQQNVRNKHELVHLRDETSLGKSEKGINKKLYSCDLCAKNFSSRSGLYLHSNMHSDKYKCSTCGRRFGDNADLRRHTRTHTKEKPFKCEFCLKCFAQKGHLNTHLLCHSSERPHVCDICDKRFKSKRDKSQHALIHLRKK